MQEHATKLAGVSQGVSLFFQNSNTSCTSQPKMLPPLEGRNGEKMYKQSSF